MRARRLGIIALGLVVFAGAAQADGAAVSGRGRWVIRDLGVPLEGTFAGPYINDQGQVTGISAATGTHARNWHAFLWHGGRVRDLGTLGGAGSVALAINEAGHIVGSSDTGGRDADGSPVEHAFLWAAGRMRDLGTLGGIDSGAYALNNRDQVVGSSEIKRSKDRNGPSVSHAFLWEDGKMIDLGTLGGEESDASSINERGQVAGLSKVGPDVPGYQPSHGFLWANRHMTDLGGELFATPLINERGQIAWPSRIWQRGRSQSLRPLVDSSAMNDSGRVVGYCTAKGRAIPCSWRDGMVRRLGTLPHGDRGQASDINARGQIVGRRNYARGRADTHGFVWENGKMTDLGTLGGDSSEATDINNTGQIVGSSTTPAGEIHAVIWTWRPK